MKRVTMRNLDAVMARLVAYAVQTQGEERQLVAEDINTLLNRWEMDDAFGTEGQNDPRGDQRV